MELKNTYKIYIPRNRGYNSIYIIKISSSKFYLDEIGENEWWWCKKKGKMQCNEDKIPIRKQVGISLEYDILVSMSNH